MQKKNIQYNKEDNANNSKFSVKGFVGGALFSIVIIYFYFMEGSLSGYKEAPISIYAMLIILVGIVSGIFYKSIIKAFLQLLYWIG
jgi:multisubunit Na+/H+ antiporter MnhE subunit